MSEDEETSEDKGTLVVRTKEFERIIKTLLDKLPKFLDELTKAMSNEKFVKRFGTSVSLFYYSLEQEGMDEEKALELTKEYIRIFNIAAIVKGLNKVENIRNILGFIPTMKED